MSIGIITDSHSGIGTTEAEELGIMILPMPFFINGTCYYEGKNITREEFFEKLKNMEDISTSQPTPAEVMDIWDKALEKFDQVVYIPISSGLSGSCQTATTLAGDEPYEGKVFVVDNGRVATPMHQSVLDALELVKEGCTAAQVKERLENAKKKMGIYIAIDNLAYLKKGGRITSSAAVMAGLLNIKPILKFDIGILSPHKKCRGFAKAKKAMIEDMKALLEEQYPEELANGDVHILAASSADEETTDKWVQEIQEAFPDTKVMCDPLSFGVTCHIGPGGLGIGYSVRP